MSNVIPLPTARGAATPLDLFLRVGEAHYGQIANLYADRNRRRGLTDMITNSKRRSIIQEARAMTTLNQVPDLVRTGYFLEKEVAEADRFARQVKELKPLASELQPKKGQTREQASESLIRRLAGHGQLNEKMRSSLENLHALRGLYAPRAPAEHLSERIASSARRSK